MLKLSLIHMICLAAALPGSELKAQSGDQQDSASPILWGVQVGAGYFNFRNSLYVEVGPDPPGNLSEDWYEFIFKPWASFEWDTEFGTWFGKASWVYARTGRDASEISGGGAWSTDFDDLYLGWRKGDAEDGMIEITGGRYSYQIANSFLLNDGYSDGGSRGGYWSNPRTAWAPGIRLAYLDSAHELELFYLERDERPESDSDTRIKGINYQWHSPGMAWVLGASYLALEANELEPQRDGADVWNLRAFISPLSVPLTIEAEWVREDNGPALDATAWYIQPYYTWENTPWKPTLYYRYAYFEGDNPDTPANEDYDMLFPGFHDWGSWWQGEIAGEYFLSNSNLKTHMLRLHSEPRSNIGTGLLWFDFTLDQPGSYNGGVSSDQLATEINWYLDWTLNQLFTFSFVLARNQPGAAVKEAFNRTKPFKYAMVYVVFHY